MRNHILYALFLLFTSCAWLGADKKGVEYQLSDINALILDSLKTYDQTMPEPQPGDWLGSQVEQGQSYEEYLKFNPSGKTKERNKLYIQPIGNFLESQNMLLGFTRDYMELILGWKRSCCLASRIKRSQTPPDDILTPMRLNCTASTL